MVSFARDVIASPLPPTLSEFELIRTRDQRCCQELLSRWATPVKSIASGYASRSSDLDDLLQVGYIAVFQAALKYDPSCGFPFANYAKRAIKNAVIKEACRLVHQREYETPISDNLGEDNSSREEIVSYGGLALLVHDWVRELPEPYATIYRLLYVAGMKQRWVARHFGVSQPRVAQMHQSFLDLARKAIID